MCLIYLNVLEASIYIITHVIGCSNVTHPYTKEILNSVYDIMYYVYSQCKYGLI